MKIETRRAELANVEGSPDEVSSQMRDEFCQSTSYTLRIMRDRGEGDEQLIMDTDEGQNYRKYCT